MFMQLKFVSFFFDGFLPPYHILLHNVIFEYLDGFAVLSVE